MKKKTRQRKAQQNSMIDGETRTKFSSTTNREREIPNKKSYLGLIIGRAVSRNEEGMGKTKLIGTE